MMIERALCIRAATLLALEYFLATAPPCSCFAPLKSATSTVAIGALPSSAVKLTALRARNDDRSGSAGETENTKNPLELASWYAVEAFGKAFGSKKSSGGDINEQVTDAIDFTKPPSSMEETLKRIQLDNDRSYFLSGEVDRYIYDEECTFADPFVSFDGRDRFIDNLSNLGSFIINYDAKLIKYDVDDGGKEINTKVSELHIISVSTYVRNIGLTQQMIICRLWSN